MTRFEIFRRLHHAPPILALPNCWDAAGARIYEVAGFPAIATSSAALANSLGAADGEHLDLDAHLAAVERIVATVSVPVTVDFESGYAANSTTLGANVRRLADTGAVGYNLEDTQVKGTLYSPDEQCDRISAAKSAAPELFLNARTDIFLDGIGPPDSRLERTKARLTAFLAAGADGIFVPGIADRETIADIARTFRKKPLNILAGSATTSLAELEELGVSRVSIGSWPMRRTLAILRDIAREMRRDGTFAFMRDPAVGYDEVNALFSQQRTAVRSS